MTSTVLRPSCVSYPHFSPKIINLECDDYDRGTSDNLVEKMPYYVQGFPFKTKGKRKDDLIVFESGDSEHYGNIFLLENPLNRTYTSREL